MSESLAHSLAADPAVLQAVERAIAELRRGRPVLLTSARGEAILVEAAEGAGEARLAELAKLSGEPCRLALTARRAASLGLIASGSPERAAPDSGDGAGDGAGELSGQLSGGEVVTLDLSGLPVGSLAELADPTSGRRVAPVDRREAVVTTPELAATAVDLVKLARLLPAALLAPAFRLQGPKAAAILRVSEAEVAEYRFAAARTLTRVADARVPLLGAEDARIVAFRPADGGHEHLAIVIGTPAPGQPVLARLHSECFTGDLLSSLRCDCGDQLRGAIEAIAEAGAGVLLYLAQEGRGIGLVNKLRAYTLQDRGADTLEANEQLGFDADERIYLPAAEMLRQLGFRRVRLLTNNPDKVRALARCGISVEERVPHAFPSNSHNEAYLATKAERFGHLF